MAAEASCPLGFTEGPIPLATVTTGNGRASLTPLQIAEQVASEWVVVAHQENTATGFSGTAFRNITTPEQVISFSSTEFVDDDARDNQAMQLDASLSSATIPSMFERSSNQVAHSSVLNDFQGFAEGDVLEHAIPSLASALGVGLEVTMENKDVGFVNAGQEAEIKLETFPFTRYGTVGATVSRVSADAVNDEKRGALFQATLALKATQIDVDGKSIRLQPGMNLTAEIKTGERRVIEFLFSPIQRTGNKGLRER
ncbi:HlyD family secretion protein [Caenimonas aquaedulcis]|uniref:HlyD family secretion protein n=1 Tax=Caenimonas aquaedulcis TaxID=2793270 RepID=A0A931H611_9BURK|nr:HlyD family secretion protein [Caenimonas aquaedulcis]MBG9389188.1 HlyD family secretion protein [Caenimonas aquaedulcis]